MLMLSDYAVALGYTDPASHLRGKFETEADYEQIVREAGGAVHLVRSCAARINAKLLQRPVVGAIGVIGSAAQIDRQFGAIYDGESWNVRFRDGVGPMIARPLAVWSI